MSHHCSELATFLYMQKSVHRARLKWPTHSVSEVMETAESKRTAPKGPTFAFSTRSPCLVRSSLMGSLCPDNPIACNTSSQVYSWR